jgi:regulator-associated protein of mTOR
MSASLGGDIKFWDLRLSMSTKTLEIQRSPITAFAGHPRIPLLATGSQDQFIKILTPDGDTLNVKRYHEVFRGSTQRIGPVSCLAFHPNTLLLAAGFTDEFISIYSPMSYE